MSKLQIGGKLLEFGHTAANNDIHMFINNMHDPSLCPECIEPGALTAPEPTTKEEKESV